MSSTNDKGNTIEGDDGDSFGYPAATIDEMSPTSLLKSIAKDKSANKGIE